MNPNDAIGRCCDTTWTPNTARLEQSGPHVKAVCGICGHYLVFIPQKSTDYTFYFGKHKDELVASVWRTDPDYCRWLRAQPGLKPRIAEVLDATRSTTS